MTSRRHVGAASSPKKNAAASAARVRVGREVAGRGGKGVSVITGLPLAPAELEALATKLKKSCGAGGASVARVRPAVVRSRGGAPGTTASITRSFSKITTKPS